MIWSVLGRKGYGHTTEQQRQTSKCMFGIEVDNESGADEDAKDEV